MEPNPQQSAVVDFGKTGVGSLNLIACAGTGKTTTLLQLVSHLKGATWFCAFNKAIVSEIEFKVDKMPGISKDNVRVSTVHAAGFKSWNGHVKPAKCRVEGRKLMSLVDELKLTNPIYQTKGNLIRKLVSYAKSAGFGVLKRITVQDNWMDLIEHFGLDLEDDGVGTKQDWYKIISAAIVLYNRSLEECKAIIDFDDMLLAPLYFKSRFPQYANILIDEAQDISPLRLKLILSCLKLGGRVIAVGDPNQAIYGFTGADAESMDTIKSFTNARELPLTVTYRCPKSVVALAQRWVPRITAHESAPEGIVRSVSLAAKAGNGDGIFWDCAPFKAGDAILCRNTRPIVELAYAMLKRKIACMVEGRDIGQGLIKLAERFKTDSTTQLTILLNEYRVQEIAKFTKMKQEFKAQEIEDRCETLQVLIECAESEGHKRVSEVIDLINGLFGDTVEGKKPECLILSTIHKSKGREWPRVFLLGRNRYMPSKWAKQPWELEQETNLCYVAVTRAQKELIEVEVPMK